MLKMRMWFLAVGLVGTAWCAEKTEKAEDSNEWNIWPVVSFNTRTGDFRLPALDDRPWLVDYKYQEMGSDRFWDSYLFPDPFSYSLSLRSSLLGWLGGVPFPGDWELFTACPLLSLVGKQTSSETSSCWWFSPLVYNSEKVFYTPLADYSVGYAGGWGLLSHLLYAKRWRGENYEHLALLRLLGSVKEENKSKNSVREMSWMPLWRRQAETKVTGTSRSEWTSETISPLILERLVSIEELGLCGLSRGLVSWETVNDDLTVLQVAPLFRWNRGDYLTVLGGRDGVDTWYSPLIRTRHSPEEDSLRILGLWESRRSTDYEKRLADFGSDMFQTKAGDEFKSADVQRAVVLPVLNVGLFRNQDVVRGTVDSVSNMVHVVHSWEAQDEILEGTICSFTKRCSASYDGASGQKVEYSETDNRSIIALFDSRCRRSVNKKTKELEEDDYKLGFVLDLLCYKESKAVQGWSFSIVGPFLSFGHEKGKTVFSFLFLPILR